VSISKGVRATMSKGNNDTLSLKVAVPGKRVWEQHVLLLFYEFFKRIYRWCYWIRDNRTTVANCLPLYIAILLMKVYLLLREIMWWFLTSAASKYLPLAFPWIS